MIPVSNESIRDRLTSGDGVICEYSIQFINLNLTIESSDIWEGGVEFDDAVSSDSEFQFGTAIINKCTITINNNTGTYDSYEFEGKDLVVKVNLINPDNQASEIIKKGCFTVNEATYTDNLITLECYDRMFLFDQPYDNATCEYPATLEQIVKSACYDLTPTYVDRVYDYSIIQDLRNWVLEEVYTTISYNNGVNTFTFLCESGKAEKLRIAIPVEQNTNYTLSMNITTGAYSEYSGVRENVTYNHHTYLAVAKQILLLHEPLDFQQSSLLGSDRIMPSSTDEYSVSFNSGSLQKVYLYLDLSAIVDGTNASFTISNIDFSEISSSGNNSSSSSVSSYTEEGTLFGSFQSDMKSLTINRRPKSGTTYREVISWVAQLTGCYARFNNEGKLDIKWFADWPDGSVLSVFNKSLAHHTYDITGIRGTYKAYAENEEVLYGNESTSYPVIEAISDDQLSDVQLTDVESAYVEVFKGSPTYVLEIKENDFLSVENAKYVVRSLYNKFYAFKIRRANVTCISNIRIEAGDLINVKDTKHNTSIWINVTGVRYTSGSAQTLTSAGEGASFSATVGNSVETRNYMKMSNRATQIEYNIAREYDETKVYSNGDYVTYNNLIYKYVGDEDSGGDGGDDDDDVADWENEIQNGTDYDDPDFEPITFNSVAPITRSLRSGGTVTTQDIDAVPDDDNSGSSGTEIDAEPDNGGSGSSGGSSGSSGSGSSSSSSSSGTPAGDFDSSKWQRVVLTDELGLGVSVDGDSVRW